MNFRQDGVLSYILAPLTLRPGDQAHDVGHFPHIPSS